MRELIRLCADKRHDVVEAASRGVTQLLTHDPKQLGSTISELVGGRHPTVVLKAILEVPDAQLVKVQNELLVLVKAPSEQLRQLMVTTLATARWVSRAVAVQTAQSALQDSAPSVRNRAVLTLRALERRQDQ